MGNTLLGCRILMLGLNNAGKTSIVQLLETGKPCSSPPDPSVGFSVKEIEDARNKIKYSVWDVAGRESVRSLWKHYFEATEALVWVVDASDASRLDESLRELTGVLTIGQQQLRDVPILLLANKMDMHTLTAKQIYEQFKDALMIGNPQRKYFIQGTSALTGAGVQEGIAWLSNTLWQIQRAAQKSKPA